MRTLLRDRRILRMLAAACAPLVAAAMVLDAVHVHPFPTSAHGPNCPHHVTSAPTTPIKAKAASCPICALQQNQSQRSSPAWSGRVAVTAALLISPATIDRPGGPAMPPAPFRGPPASQA